MTGTTARIRNRIFPNNLAATVRRPIVGFTIQIHDYPKWFEVAIATDPTLFQSSKKATRTPKNFYSTRNLGPLPAQGDDTIFLLEPAALLNFVGQKRLYYALATFQDPSRADVDTLFIPSDEGVYVDISTLTEESLKRVRRIPSRGNLANNTGGYGMSESGSLSWAGDAVQPGTQPVNTPDNATSPDSSVSTENNPSAGVNNASTNVAETPLAYDDGFDPNLWSESQGFIKEDSNPPAHSLALVRPAYNPSNPSEARASIIEFTERYNRWRAGVPDTSIFPHSAICHLKMTFPDGNYTGTGFYISNDLILTCAHNVFDAPTGADASSILITPGKNGNNNTPFGSFRVQRADWVYHPSYNGSRDHDLAVIKVNTPPPNGLYFDVLEDLRISINEPIIVCGYAAESVDRNKQNLDGDTVRDVSQNLELIRYNLQTEQGSSGSPVFYITGVEDEQQRMSVPVFPIIGVHTSPYDDQLNEGCRLSEAKINWIRGVGHNMPVSQQVGTFTPHHNNYSHSVENPMSNQGLIGRGSNPPAHSLALVKPTYNPSSPLKVLQTIFEFIKRYTRWQAGVPDTSIFPHSAICHLDINFPRTSGIGTGFYISDDLILTCAHNVFYPRYGGDASSMLITPGKNGKDIAPFGSFRVQRSDWVYHPSYNLSPDYDLSSADYDLAVIKVNTPPPNGLYFDVLEDLRISINEPIVVCGYSADTVDSDKQNLDGDTVRDVSKNLESIRYNSIIEPGSSGSPVFYITGVEDEQQQMSVPVFPVIGVNTFTSTPFNGGCRLSEAKINWIRGVRRNMPVSQQVDFTPHSNNYSHSIERPMPNQRLEEQQQSFLNTMAGDLDDDLYGIEGPIPDQEEGIQEQGLANPMSVEYPLASRYVQSRWYGRRSAPRNINRVVIHITDGRSKNASAIANYFRNPGDGRKVSAHYVVGQNGEVIQMVRENDVAWHAKKANSDSIGIEHNANTRGMNPTEAQYCDSSALVRDICERNNIPMDRQHIVGHSEADPSTSHAGCPNDVWDWDYFMGMVQSGTCYSRAQNTTTQNFSSSQPMSWPQSSSLGQTTFDSASVERMRARFHSNKSQAAKMKSVFIVNSGLEELLGKQLKEFGDFSQNANITTQSTMSVLQSYGVAKNSQEFEFNDVNGQMTRGINRPNALKNSIEEWLVSQAEASQMLGWHVFVLSIMDGYHSVVLALNFNGLGHPSTLTYWADQIYSGWDDVTGSLDERITQLTQQWWDPLPQDRKARSRVVIWPLQAERQTSISQEVNMDMEGEDGIEGYEEEPEVTTQALNVQDCIDGCSDGFCPQNQAADASTNHFNLEEFRCRDGTAVPQKFRGSVQLVMENLEVLRSELGNKPITIISGYRTCSYNCTLNGAASRSRHLCGQAADIRVADVPPREVHATIERLIGENRMRQGGLGLYNGFVHYDVRGTRARWDRSS